MFVRMINNSCLLVAILITVAARQVDAFQGKPEKNNKGFPYRTMPEVLEGTRELAPEEDRSIEILEDAHVFIEDKIRKSKSQRSRYWRRDFSSKEAYERSVEPNRKRFMEIIGVEDKTKPLNSFKQVLKDEHPAVSMEKIAVNNDPLVIGETSSFRIYQVRWPVLNRVYGEGLLLEPKTGATGNIIALPDADQLPEQLAGLHPGIPAASQFARRLAENKFRVLIPVLINRTLLFPGTLNQQTHREWIYRQAFHMGRHIIGYEVQKVMSAADWFKKAYPEMKIGVAGYHEGGLLALYTAAIDTRIDATLVSGYFNTREKVWDEPIYRNVWNLLTEFGDAEIASMIAPRALVVEHSLIPEMVDQAIKPGDLPVMNGQWPLTGYKGKLRTPEGSSVETEFRRIAELTSADFLRGEFIAGVNHAPVEFGSQKTLEKFLELLGTTASLPLSGELPRDTRASFNATERQIRQVKELEDHAQWLVRDSDYERNQFFLYTIMPEFEKRTWSTKPHHPTYPAERFTGPAKKYRKIFHEQIIGKFEDELLAPDPRTRKLYDNDRWTGFEVELDVYPDLRAAGILLIPKDLKPGERRPVVVCQHGRDGFPQKLIEDGYTAYNNTASKLADRGFIVYAPYNPYRGEDKYRWLVRKATNVGKSMFSFIISQHDQTLRWLETLPFVDENRIAFYGLSFGGETAMRVPSVLERYSLSICSGDFGDYSRKVVDTHFIRGFMNSMEWEIPVFRMGSTFSHAEMAYLIFPRPFMVERGHDDLVQQTEWVSYEYGKVKYFYDQFGLGDKTEIEYFNGGHSMRGEGTFDFLHKHLNWKSPDVTR